MIDSLTGTRGHTIARALLALAATGLLAAAPMASAQSSCFGTGVMRTCNDLATGNSYTTTRIGNSSLTQGYNARTGSNWSQNTQNIGNMSITNGTASNGRPWSATTTNLGGGTTITNGIDSRGRPFSVTCTTYGGCR